MPLFDALLEMGGRKTWKLPQLTGFNKLPPRATLYPFPSPIAAQTQERKSSPWFLSLNGVWDFKILSRPEEVTDEGIREAVWHPIKVPGNWTMQGFGHPHYTNVMMPFPNIPPDVPETNPTGIYRRTFRFPPSWTGRRIVLHCGGCEGALYVYLNDRPVGISKDLRTPAEFDITSLIRSSEENELIMLVVQWSDASFLEDQDHWWQAGLQREVYLYTTNVPHIQDIFAIGDLTEDYLDGTAATCSFSAWTEAPPSTSCPTWTPTRRASRSVAPSSTRFRPTGRSSCSRRVTPVARRPGAPTSTCSRCRSTPVHRPGTSRPRTPRPTPTRRSVLTGRSWRIWRWIGPDTRPTS